MARALLGAGCRAVHGDAGGRKMLVQQPIRRGVGRRTGEVVLRQPVLDYSMGSAEGEERD